MLDLFLAYSLNLIVNSFLSFMTVWLLVELLLFFCRVKNPRTKALFRLLPIIKIFIDPFLYDFSSWSFLQDIDPVNAEKGTRTLTASLQYESFYSWTPSFMKLQMSTESGTTFTIADLFFSLCNSLYLKGAIFTFAILLLCKISFHIKRRKSHHQQLHNILKECVPYTREVKNRKLHTDLKKASVSIFQQKNFDSPFSCWNKTPCIVFPKIFLRNLPQDEYEAILGHELEHIRWRDGFVKQILSFSREILWWIPTHKLFQMLEHNVELSCDRAIYKYGIDPIDLAKALLKTGRLKKENKLPALCQFSSGKKFTHRIRQLFDHSKEQVILFYLQATLLACFSVVLLLGRFWIF